jgi:hypothetical protein
MISTTVCCVLMCRIISCSATSACQHHFDLHGMHAEYTRYKHRAQICSIVTYTTRLQKLNNAETNSPFSYVPTLSVTQSDVRSAGGSLLRLRIKSRTALICAFQCHEQVVYANMCLWASCTCVLVGDLGCTEGARLYWKLALESSGGCLKPLQGSREGSTNKHQQRYLHCTLPNMPQTWL